MTTIARLHSSTLVAGLAMSIAEVGEELDQLVNEENAKETRLASAETDITTINTGTWTKTGTANFSGTVNVADARLTLTGATSGTTVLKSGAVAGSSVLTLPVATDTLVGKATTDTLTNKTLVAPALGTPVSGDLSNCLGGIPYLGLGSAVPKYASTTTFTQAYICDADSTNAVAIRKTSSTTVDISTTGLNGITLGASNLTGTVTVTSASTTVTFSSTQAGVLQVGDVITTAGGQSRRLASGSGTAWVSESTFSSTETAVNVKRGGRAPNTHYYLYSTTDGATPGLILSSRNVVAGDTLVDLPSGYTYYRQQAFSVLTDTTANSKILFPFVVASGWPLAPRVLYKSAESAAPYLMLNSGNNTSFTAVALTSLVPKNATLADLTFNAGTAPTSVYVRATGSGLTTGSIVMTRGNSSGQTNTVANVLTDTSQSIDYKVGDQSVSIFLNGYTVTAF